MKRTTRDRSANKKGAIHCKNSPAGSKLAKQFFNRTATKRS